MEVLLNNNAGATSGISQEQWERCQNISLRYNVFIPWNVTRNDDGSINKIEIDKEVLKRQWSLNDTSPLDTLLSRQIERQQCSLKGLEAMGFKVKYDIFKTISPLSIGLGNPNPYENGFSLQKPGGYPIIRASAQKGLTSYFAETELNIRRVDYEKVFGSRRNKGCVLFFDAIPRSAQSIFKTDVINPHYSGYYSNKGAVPPVDYDTPKPVFFLAIRKKVSFFFSMAAKEEDDLNKTWEWLEEALRKWGIGAKTFIGNGRMKKTI